MNAKSFAALCLFAIGMAAGGLLTHHLAVPPLERDVAVLKAEIAAREYAAIGEVSRLLSDSARISDSAMLAREESHGNVQAAADRSLAAIHTAPQSGGIDLDAVLPAAFTDPIVGMYCQTARVVDCAGGLCRNSPASGLCAQADVGAQITLTVRELGAALVRCARWTGEAGPDRLVIERHVTGLKEAKGMGKEK